MARPVSALILAVLAASSATIPLACGTDESATPPSTLPDGAPPPSPDASEAPEAASPKPPGLQGPVGQWVWHDIPGTLCANGTPTGIGVNRGPGSAVIIYLAGGSGCFNETCDTSVSYAQEGYDAADFQTTLEGKGESSFPAEGIFNRFAGKNPFNDASFVFVPYCSGDYYAGKATVQWPSWTATFAGAKNIDLIYSELATAFPNASRVTLSGGSAGSLGSLLTYWKLVNAFRGKRVDLVADSFFVFETSVSPFFAEKKHEIWKWEYPEGCTECGTELRSVYRHNSKIAPAGARLAIVGSQNDLFLTAGHGMLVNGEFDDNVLLVQDYVKDLANTKYFVADGDEHILLKEKELDSPNTDSAVSWCSSESTCGNDTHYLYEFLTRMQDDDPAWQSWSSLGKGLLTCKTECNGRTCGADSCGGVCGTCPAAETCDAELGVCVGTPPLTFGESSVLETTHQATELFVTKATLGSHTRMLQRLSIYVEEPAGSIRLGIYDATGEGGAPGKLLAETPLFTAGVGWNHQPIPARLSLPAGDYWLAHQATSGSTKARKSTTAGSYHSTSNLGSMPATWPKTTVEQGRFSVFATAAP